MDYRTIRKTQQAFPFLSQSRLREWVKQGRCPGFYSGNRFLVDVDALRTQLEAESAQNGAGR